jgi:hypothetical protein
MNMSAFMYNINKFLSELSQILPLHFEIRDRHGRKVIGEHSGRDNQEDLFKKLFTLAASSQKAAMIESADSGNIWGVPIKIDSDSIEHYVVVQHCQHINLNDNNGNMEIAAMNAIDNTIAFIHNLVDVLSIELSQEKELEAFTEELSSRYEEINFFCEVAGKIGEFEKVESSIKDILQKLIKLVDANIIYIHTPQKGLSQGFAFNESGHLVDFADFGLINNLSSKILALLQDSCDYLSYSDIEKFDEIFALLNKYDDLLVVPMSFYDGADGYILCLPKS